MDKSAKQALLIACTWLSELGQCTHYPGYTCDKDFPKECPKCLARHFRSMARKDAAEK